MGRDVFAEAQSVVVGIVRANFLTGPEKEPHIVALREHLEILKLLLRLSKDLNLISPAQFGATVELTDAVGKQASGWLKYTKGSRA